MKCERAIVNIGYEPTTWKRSEKDDARRDKELLFKRAILFTIYVESLSLDERHLLTGYRSGMPHQPLR